VAGRFFFVSFLFLVFFLCLDLQQLQLTLPITVLSSGRCNSERKRVGAQGHGLQPTAEDGSACTRMEIHGSQTIFTFSSLFVLLTKEAIDF
jgi:hypothetical protein